MSKVDAQRAMREAKYARISALGASRREAAAVSGTSVAPAAAAPTTPAPTTPTPTTPPPAAKPVRTAKAAATAAPEGERCGHKSMNGRACTREAAHPEKNHRYS